LVCTIKGDGQKINKTTSIWIKIQSVKYTQIK
jgi:hypothetical protein